MNNPIPVICDRCGAQGAAGDATFADFGDLLDFAPVPRRNNRVDGWSEDRQRAFIAALAVTGSPRRAAAALGKSATGVLILRRQPGAESFAAAWDRAMAMFETQCDALQAAGVSAAIRSNPRLALPAPPPPAVQDEPEPEEGAWIRPIVEKYLLKLAAERDARIGGRIAEADFYLRQLTFTEVLIDLGSGDGMKTLLEWRSGGRGLLHIAETPFSHLLDAARRDHWVACGDPPRPEHPLRHLLAELGVFRTEPLEAAHGGTGVSTDEQWRRFEAQYAEDAAAQVAWEAEARRDHERRRAAPPFMGEETRRAGQPAPSEAKGTGLTSRDSLP